MGWVPHEWECLRRKPACCRRVGAGCSSGIFLAALLAAVVVDTVHGGGGGRGWAWQGWEASFLLLLVALEQLEERQAGNRVSQLPAGLYQCSSGDTLRPFFKMCHSYVPS